MSINKSGNFELNSLNEYVLEIRYKPNPKFLDCRGEWARLLSKEMNLYQWQITQNRIDIFKLGNTPSQEDNQTINLDNADERAFISFRNAGLTAKNMASGNQFKNRVKILLNFLFSQKEVFDNKIEINRIGVKTRFGNIYSGRFEKLLSLCVQNYLIPSQGISNIFDGSMCDFGGYLNFKTNDDISINSMIGPMESKQIQRYFPFIEESPETILYFEIDSFCTPNIDLDLNRLSNQVNDLVSKNFVINNKIVKLISGE